MKLCIILFSSQKYKTSTSYMYVHCFRTLMNSSVQTLFIHMTLRILTTKVKVMVTQLTFKLKQILVNLTRKEVWMKVTFQGWMMILIQTLIVDQMMAPILRLTKVNPRSRTLVTMETLLVVRKKCQGQQRGACLGHSRKLTHKLDNWMLAISLLF